MTVKEADIQGADAGDAMPSSLLEQRVAAMMNRTPEEIAASRARLFALSPDPRPLPPGKTLEDVIVGHWPGDESDEEIDAILEDLS